MINPFSIVGLDLSLTGSGVACCGRTATIKSNAKLPTEPRIDKILSDLFETIDELSNKSAALFVIEGLAFASKTGSVAERSFLHHEVRYKLWQQGKQFAICPPTVLKLWVTGKGNAGKDEMMIAVTKTWPDANAKNNNEADALGLYHLGMLHCMPGSVKYENMPTRNKTALEKIKWP